MSARLWRQDVTTGRNEDFIRAYQMKANGTPSDITGASIRMMVRDAAGNTLADASTSNGKITITAAATGNWQVRIPLATVAAMNVGVHTYDVVITYASTEVKRILIGSFNVVPGVTR